MERYKIKVAVYIFLIKENKILLARRVNTGWQDGNYGIPAGHIESDETMVDGAIREMKEEAGVTVKPEDMKYIHTMHRKGRYIDIFFTASAWEGEPHIVETDKCDDMNWFPLNDLPKNIIPSVKHAIQNFLDHVTFSEFDQQE